jgi:hypothetical protein
MTYLLCLQLMLSLGLSTFNSTALQTLIASQNMFQTTFAYNLQTDLYFFDVPNSTLFQISTDDGSLTEIGTAS